jgi:LuxR family maltose regulon positive regulatory protein
MALVARPRLARRLEEGLRGKLTLVSAPAGSGKTTLLVEWAQQTELPVAWLSLGEEENDSARFLAYLAAALEGVKPGIEALAAPLLHLPRAVPLEPALPVLLNAVTSTSSDFALVLDDYHAITSEAVHSKVTFLLENLPPQMRVIIATRSDPPFNLAQLRAYGQLTEVRAEELAFTPEEVALFLGEVMRLELTPEETAALGARTEGWVAGLQLAGLSLQGRADAASFIEGFGGGHRHIFDYLSEEVLHRQPAEVQEFLLWTSVLDRLCAPLCEAVTKDEGQRTKDEGRWTEDDLSFRSSSLVFGPSSSDSAATLLSLERGNLFLAALDEERKWYSYHPLFGEFLRAEFERRQPEGPGEAHKRAARWYAGKGLAAEAVGHALAGRDYGFAAELVEQAAWGRLTYGEVDTVLRWVEALPDEVVRDRPRLLLAHAWALTYANRFEEAEGRLAETGRALAVGAIDKGERRDMEGEVAAISARLAANDRDLPRIREWSRLALELLPRERLDLRGQVALNLGLSYLDQGELDEAERYLSEAESAGRAAGNVRLSLFGMRYLAAVETARGQLHKAAKICLLALRMAYEHRDKRTNRPVPAGGVANMGMARLHYEWNDLEKAREDAEEGIALAKEGGEKKVLIDGYIVLAKVLHAMGETGRALETVEKAVEIVGADWGHRARLWLAQGKVAAAARWVGESGLGVDDTLIYDNEIEHLTLCRVLIAQGKYDQALYLLGRLLEAAEEGKRTRSVIEVLTLRAVAHQGTGERGQALADLDRALSLAAPEGFVRLFVEEAAPVLGLLRSYQRSATSSQREYARRLVGEFGSPGSRVQSPQSGLARVDSALWTRDPGLVELLSEREAQVLRLMSAGLSNAEIARELVIGVGTVKTHANNIYGKLGVRGRVQAVARAREVGLV